MEKIKKLKTKFLNIPSIEERVQKALEIVKKERNA